MPRDHQETIRALRAKAQDKTVGDAEREALLRKAETLEAKYPPTIPVGAFAFRVPPYVRGANDADKRAWADDILKREPSKSYTKDNWREAWLDSIIEDGYLDNETE